jgi:hypothetical protein
VKSIKILKSIYTVLEPVSNVRRNWPGSDSKARALAIVSRCP